MFLICANFTHYLQKTTQKPFFNICAWSFSKFRVTMAENKKVQTNRKSKFKKLLYKRLYILQWLPQYSKTDAVADCIAGITVGLTMMPQSIAYAALANLSAQYGLYSCFIGSFVYVFFGTVKEISIGPTNLTSLLTGAYTEFLSIDFVILLTFLAGCIELSMGVFKLGFLVDFISVPVTSGFTSAASTYVIMTQLKGLFGIKFRSSGLFDYLQKFFQNISYIQIPDTILGLSSIVFLLALRTLNTIPIENKQIKKAFWLISICRNAMIVVITGLIAFYYESKEIPVPFKITGHVPRGIPNFQFPNFDARIGNETFGFTDMASELGSAILVIPLIAVLVNVAIAKAFACGTMIDATQEMIALGLSNLLGSCVQAMPTCGAFTRCAVANASGVRTPLAGVYAGSLILLALTFLTPYFYYVPKSTLSAVLISSVIFMIDYKIIPQLWKCSKFDLFLTISTFAICLICGVEVGILAGVALNILSLLKLWFRPSIEHQISSSKGGYTYILIKPELGLLFPGVDYLSQEVIKISSNIGNNKMPVVLDFSNVIRIDFTAIRSIQNLVDVFKQKDVQLVFWNVNDVVYRTLKTMIDLKALGFCCDDDDDLNTKICKDIVQAPLLTNSRKNSFITLSSHDVDQLEEMKKRLSLYDSV